jgi:hypothetical protein
MTLPSYAADRRLLPADPDVAGRRGYVKPHTDHTVRHATRSRPGDQVAAPNGGYRGRPSTNPVA